MMPFPGAATDTANATLLFSALAALFYVFALDAAPSLKRTVVKTLAVALLGVLAFLQGGPLLLVIALALSALGDAFLSRDGDKAFLAGLASFLAAHLVYVALFHLAGGGTGFLLSEPWRIVVAVVMVVFAVLMPAKLWPVVASDMRWPIAIYVVAILLMGLAALTMGNPWVIAGAMCFMASDGILATEKFLMASASSNRMPARYGVWVLYYAAEVLITVGFLLG